MRKLDKVPQEVLDAIRSEHERALSKVLNEKYKEYLTLPVRPVKMRIKRENEKDNLEETIVPATSIYVSDSGFLPDGTIASESVAYYVWGQDTPFPYGHIYQSSGYVCLGSIFVPAKISKYSPQQPLETLFLHNDRNVNHGGSSINLTKEQIASIQEICTKYEISVSEDVKNTMVPKTNLLKSDSVWILGADVYKSVPLNIALSVMGQIYEVIFGNPLKK